MKYQLSVLAINKVLGTFQICGNTRKHNSQYWSDFGCELVPAEVTTSSQNNECFFLGLPSPNLQKTVALNEGKSFRNKQIQIIILSEFLDKGQRVRTTSEKQFIFSKEHLQILLASSKQPFLGKSKFKSKTNNCIPPIKKEKKCKSSAM